MEKGSSEYSFHWETAEGYYGHLWVFCEYEQIKLGSCGVVAIIVIVVVRLLVWRYDAGMTGSYAAQMRAGGDQVGNANESYTCAVQVHLTQLHTTQELQTWEIKHMLEMFLLY